MLPLQFSIFFFNFSDWELSVSKKIWKNQGSKSGTNHSDSKWEIQTPRGRIWNCKGSRVCPSGYKRAFGSAEYLFETEIHAKTTILCPTYLIIRKAELLLRGIIKLWKYTHNIAQKVMEKSALKKHCKDGIDFIEKRNWALFSIKGKKCNLILITL